MARALHAAGALIALLAATLVPIDPAAAQARRVAATTPAAGSAAAPAPGTPGSPILPALTEADDAFVQARAAALRGDGRALEAAAARVPADHPLRGYLEWWRLRLAIGEGRPDALSPARDGEIRAFLQQQGPTLAADLMRRDWLAQLGRRNDWSLFDAEYEAWALRDDVNLQCTAWLSQLRQGPQTLAASVAEAARETLFVARDLPRACDDLLDRLAREGGYGRGDLFRRLLLAVEAQSPSAIRTAAAQLGLDAAAVEAAIAKPQAVLERRDREIVLIALGRLAVGRLERNRLVDDDTGAAAKFLETASRAPLTETDRAWVWSLAGATAMRRLRPEALDYVRQGLATPAGDDTLGWAIRAALRGTGNGPDWKSVRALAERLSPAARRDPTWVYWHARALRAEGRAAESDAMLRTIAERFDFYGKLAAEDLGQLASVPPRATPPTEAELAEAATQPGFARALRFYAMGLRVEGNREWNFTLRGMGDRQLLAAAEFACRRAVLDRCVNTSDRTRAEHDFAQRFVAPFREQLEPIARERGLDVAWVYGLIRQESRFIMDARSSAGAQGLMQIMPPTARWIARQLGEPNFRVEQLNERETNLRFGTFYLRAVLDDLDGSPALASAAYNAGPGRPRAWRSTLPARVEGAVFAEIIPFAETRDYVKKVLSNATLYQALFTGKPQSLRGWLGTVTPKAAGSTELP